jgi:ribosomal protein S21
MRIVITLGKNEKIDRALKRFKRKFRQTQILKKLKEKKPTYKKIRKKKTRKTKRNL